MIKYLFVLSVTLLLSKSAFTQKQAIDPSAFPTWPEINDPKISDDGKYASFLIGAPSGEGSLWVREGAGSWKSEIKDGFNGEFSSDSRHFVCQAAGDKMTIIDLKRQTQKEVADVTSYQLTKEGNTIFLAYQVNSPENLLVLRNLSTGEERKFSRIRDYSFSPKGSVMILQSSLRADSNQILWHDLRSGAENVILEGTVKACSFAFSEDEHQLAFIGQKRRTGGNENALYYFKEGMAVAVMRAGPGTSVLEAGYRIGCGKIYFSRDNTKIFFPLVSAESRAEKKESGAEAAELTLWSYDDEYLPLQRKKDEFYDRARNFMAVAQISGSRVLRLEGPGDERGSLQIAQKRNTDFVLVRTKGDFSREDLLPTARPSLYLVSTLDGSRKPIVDRGLLGRTNHLSPSGKFVIWFDREHGNYFTYNTETGIKVNITKSVPVPYFDEDDDRPRKPMPIGIAGWLKKDEGVLIYDKYDIWLVDPSGEKVARNITGGYGRKNRTMLRYIGSGSANSSGEFPVLDADEEIILVALNQADKNNGFFTTKISETKEPELLTMGPYLYFYRFFPYPTFGMAATVLLKAKKEKRYVVTRMSAEEFPNLYLTSDFRHFSPLTDLAPQNKYVWMKSELVHWETFDHKKAEGILYKPDNFDPGKKYPVIFYFYEKDANGLHNYFLPKWSDGQINIAYFVSQGYLVFDPNIYYTVGETGESVYNSVESAASYLSSMPWIDSTRMGLQGHSFGGYEVQYLITRTNRFAAAASAAGFCDIIGMYGSLRTDFGVTALNLIESGQTGIGATPWQRPDLFIKNSPIFSANRVTTPLLLMHNEGDGAVPFSQGVAFFTSLRRLNKKAWLLQYGGSSHQVEGEANLRDYTLKLHQFFDHYLKGVETPEWLKEHKNP